MTMYIKQNIKLALIHFFFFKNSSTMMTPLTTTINAVRDLERILNETVIFFFLFCK